MEDRVEGRVEGKLEDRVAEVQHRKVTNTYALSTCPEKVRINVILLLFKFNVHMLPMRHY